MRNAHLHPEPVCCESVRGFFREGSSTHKKMVSKDHKTICAFFNQLGVFMAVFDNTRDKDHKTIEPFAPAAMQKDMDDYDPKVLGALAVLFLLVGVFSACLYVWAIRA
jgi:hypothetical protein